MDNKMKKLNVEDLEHVKGGLHSSYTVPLEKARELFIKDPNQEKPKK